VTIMNELGYTMFAKTYGSGVDTSPDAGTGVNSCESLGAFSVF
jgi:hypothetical protein